MRVVPINDEPMIQVESTKKTDETVVNEWYSTSNEKREAPVKKSPNDADDRTVSVSED